MRITLITIISMILTMLGVGGEDPDIDREQDSYQLVGKGKKVNIVKQLQRREEQRSTFRRLAALRKSFGENLSTTSVIKTNDKGFEEEITSKNEMEDAIIESNIHKYHQCELSCPFMQEPLLSQFGAYGEGRATQQVLDGKL